jgi:hypothetical protein
MNESLREEEEKKEREREGERPTDVCIENITLIYRFSADNK